MMNLAENLKTNNIVGLRSDTVESKIEMWLQVVGEDSDNTYKSYKGHVKEYFMFVVGKELNKLELEDLHGLTIEDTDRYRLHLNKNRKQAPSTINSKIACLSAMFQFLQVRDDEINSNIMSVARVKASTKDVSYGSLTEDEFLDLLEFCDTDGKKTLTKRMFFEVAINTGFRKNAVLNNFTWGCIGSQLDMSSGINIKVIKNVEDKGGKNDLVPISDEFYDKLMEYKESEEIENDSDDARAVSLNPKTVESVLRRWKKSYGIDDSRNITIHSIKSTGCDIVWNRTKDIKAVSDYAHHQDINTTYNHYLGKNQSLMNKASYYAFEDNKLDMSDLNDLSKEEMIELISSCSTSTVSEVLSKLDK